MEREAFFSSMESAQLVSLMHSLLNHQVLLSPTFRTYLVQQVLGLKAYWYAGSTFTRYLNHT